MYEINTEDIYEDFSRNKELYDFSNYLSQSNFHDNSNKLVNRKLKDETGGEEFIGLKPKIYSLLVDNSEHKKAKGVNKNVVAAINHNEYKDVLLQIIV